jgi:5-methylcytosine-specific restriction endonuclease McrA
MANHRKYYPTVFVCEQCGNSFTRLNKREYHFCSPRCRGFGKGRNRSKHICEWCKKEFETYPCRPGRFCSSQCRSEFGAHQLKPNKRVLIKSKGDIIWYCKQCGKEMHTFKCRVKTFCSPQCWGKSIFGKAKSGYGLAQKNSNYRGENWQSQREKTRRRDDYKCQVCGVPALDVHHIIKYRLFNGDWKSANSLSNLITLCGLHHSRVEHNHISCPCPKS